jgi:DNA/RNA endonuclease YhcR with UshA esterase domain
MKTILSILALAALAVEVSAQEANTPVSTKTAGSTPLKIGTAYADKYYDQTMIVTGNVAQVTIRPTVTFLNLDKPFPNSPFSVVIFHSHSSFYGDANALKGKSIEIKGKIKNYNDKPEIALDSTNQLTVIGGWIPSVKPPASALPKTPASSATSTNVPPAMPATNFPEIM